MSIPDNKYCSECTEYKENKCPGIPSATGEFPYNSKVHYFTDQPLKSESEKRQEKINFITNIIKENSIEKAANLLYSHFK